MTAKPPTAKSVRPPSANFAAGVGIVLVGIVLSSSCVQTWLSAEALATSFISAPTWSRMVNPKGEVAFAPVFAAVTAISLFAWVTGALWVARGSRQGVLSALASWGFYGWIWWCLIGLWEWSWFAAGAVGFNGLAQLMSASPQIWLAMCLSGWLTTLICLRCCSELDTVHLQTPATRWVWIACVLYIVIFTTMNWRLYFNLLIPHGDSAMYEEHLWNVLHGKGFRSYLDQGLFLGEHIQFVHLFLIPLYVIWPSHLTLEFLESTALALGAFPVYWMTMRQTGSDRTALAAAVAYLLYAPMQFLDIEIDLKTFRPEAFGIPLLLLTLDQLERRKLVGFAIGLTFTLTVKEDYAIIFGPLGLWIVWHEWQRTRT